MIYDYIIVGSGVAGLNAARLIPKDKKVLLLCKKSPWECNTFWAQGGAASAVDEEDIKDHIKDTMTAGANYNDEKAVEFLSRNSQKVIKELINTGLNLDKNEDGELCYTKEAAHSRNRIVHADGDATGRMLHMFLLGKFSHELQTDIVVNDLLIQDGICYGVQYFINEHEQKVAYAHNTIIASGGVGSIYKYHTNSTAIAGEVQGICSEKGIELKDMEMLQFHPTVVKGTHFARKQLLSEALRGEGAYIVDEDNKRFLFDYHKDGELAPRDIVSRAIFDYATKKGKKVFLSFENFKKDFFKKRFPNIYASLKEIGFELPFEQVPISPAFHYTMGGIPTDLTAKVEGMKNLYAVGECARTGVHGANRLASNSLTEGLVFSKEAVKNSLEEDFKIETINYNTQIKAYVRNQKIDKKIKNQLRELMWSSASMVREPQKLEDALAQVEEFLEEEVGRLLRLRLLTAKAIIEGAINRKESLGAHFLIKE